MPCLHQLSEYSKSVTCYTPATQTAHPYAALYSKSTNNRSTISCEPVGKLHSNGTSAAATGQKQHVIQNVCHAVVLQL
jgi:hypothetical protein